MVELSSHPDGVPPLTSLYLYLTAGCNLACRHCWISPVYQPNGGTGGHLEFELFMLAIEEALPLGLNHVKLTGGEPLLHPNFLQITDYLAERQIGINIESNGTIITPGIAQHLKEQSAVQHISISLDGAIQDTHDAFRGVKGSFERTVQGLLSLVEVGFRPQVIMSLHPGNKDEIEELVEQANHWGAGSVKFNIVQPSGRGETMTSRNQILDIGILVELGKWVEGDLQKRTATPLYYSWPMAFHGIKRLLSEPADTCGIFNILGILADGQVAMCGIGTQVEELCYGRLGETRLTEIWSQHPSLLALRRSMVDELEGVCSRCILRQRCRGYCVAENYLQTKRLTASYWFCQEAEEQGLFPTTRTGYK